MADWAMVVLTAVYVIATILICYFNHRSAKASKEQVAEMKRQYDEENRPYITVELVYEKRVFYGLRLTNHGKRIANHVSIQLNQDFIDSINEPEFRTQLEKQKGRACIIGIGQQYTIYFGSNKFRNNPDKAPISGQVIYSDGNNIYNDDVNIDFDTYSTFFTINSEFEDYMKEMKKQTIELSKVQETLAAMQSSEDNIIEES